MKRVSDVISAEDIESWMDSNKDMVIVDSSTGSGKSYFVKNKLYNYCKEKELKALLLTNRSITTEQFKDDLIKSYGTTYCSVMDVMVYHKISHSRIDRDVDIVDLDIYDFIICDEHQFFLEDALYNRYTDIVFDEIMNSNAKKMFMSATGNTMNQYIEKNFPNRIIKKYSMVKDFEFIDSLLFFRGYEELEDILNKHLLNNIKTIVFVDSTKKAYDLYKKFKKYSMFVCGKGSYQRRYIDENKLSTMIQNKKFDELFLITTTALDSGVSIVDNDIKDIVVSVGNIDTLIQCIGRKRLATDESINVIVDSFDNNRLGGRISNINNKLNPAKCLKNEGEEAFVNEYSRQDIYGGIIYDVILEGDNGNKYIGKQINNLMYGKHLLDLVIYKDIIRLNKKSDKKEGFAEMLCDRIDKTADELHYYISSDALDFDKKIGDLLEDLVGRYLYANDCEREHLIQSINLKDGSGRIQKGYKAINSFLEEGNFKYTIESKRDNCRKIDGEDNPNYKKTYWCIVENL